jgi:hypothetical protein
MQLKYARALPRLLVLTACSMSLASSKHFTLDLTKPALSNATASSIPGSSSAVASRRFQLPLKPLLDTAHMNKNTRMLKMKVLLTNIGDKDFAFPVSRYANTAQNNDNSDRRVFIFEVRTRGNGTSSDQVIATTYSSASIPKSFVVLHPGDTLQITLTAKLDNGAIARKNQEIQAVCLEWLIEHNRYFLSAESSELVSNPVQVGANSNHSAGRSK